MKKEILICYSICLKIEILGFRILYNGITLGVRGCVKIEFNINGGSNPRSFF
jgi:hypothetical protein